MTLQALTDLLKSRGWFIEIQISGRPLFNRQKLDQIESMHGSLKEYLEKIAKNNNVKQLAIQLYAPNGSSFIRKDFFLLDIDPVVESTKAVESPTEVVAKSTTDVEPHKPHKMDDFTTKLKNIELTTELKYLKLRNEELEKRNKELDRKNDEYYNENLKLNREVGTQKDRLELEYKTKELDLEKDKKSGLSGIMEEIKTLPPEAYQFLAGVFKIKMAPIGEGDKKEITAGGLPKHEDPDAQDAIETIYNILVKQPTEHIAMMVLVLEGLAKNEKHLKNVFTAVVERANKTTSANASATTAKDPLDDDND